MVNNPKINIWNKPQEIDPFHYFQIINSTDQSQASRKFKFISISRYWYKEINLNPQWNFYCNPDFSTFVQPVSRVRSGECTTIAEQAKKKAIELKHNNLTSRRRWRNEIKILILALMKLIIGQGQLFFWRVKVKEIYNLTSITFSPLPTPRYLIWTLLSRTPRDLRLRSVSLG